MKPPKFLHGPCETVNYLLPININDKKYFATFYSPIGPQWVPLRFNYIFQLIFRLAGKLNALKIKIDKKLLSDETKLLF